MYRRLFAFIGFASLAFVATPASAITYATSTGADSGACGAVTSPCRTLQQAVSNEPAGGYVVLKGAADFGPTEVKKSITIIGEGGATIRAKDTGVARYGVIISDAPDAVVRLRGLTIEGGGVGLDGVTWVNGKALHISDCRIRNFRNYGISPQTFNGGAFSIINTSVSKNGGYGVRHAHLFTGPAVSGYIEGLRLHENTQGGLHVEIGSKAVVVDSSATGHTTFGLGITAPSFNSAQLLMRRVNISGNNVGVKETGGDISIAASTIAGNITAATGFDTGLRSYGDNVVQGNTNNALNVFFPTRFH